MSQKLKTLAEYDQAIEQMSAEREGVRATIQDPGQRDARRRWRVLWLGRLMVRAVTRDALDRAQALATASDPRQDQLFASGLLADDGWTTDDGGVWRGPQTETPGD